MSESAPTPVARSATTRKPSAPEPAGSLVFDVGNGFTVTVTASGKLRGVRATKNALERAVRLARKAIDAGITDDAFQELLVAISEAEKLSRAAQEATARVKNALLERRPEPAAELQATGTPQTNPLPLPETQP